MKSEEIKQKIFNKQKEDNDGILWIQTKEFKQKSEKTSMEKYGVKTALLLPEIIKKRVETLINRPEEEKLKTKNSVRATNLEKYGCEIKANLPIICEHCGHQTILQWYNRKHRDAKCLNQS